MKEVYKMDFVCECGKQFDNAQSFNGHKSSCKTHLILKYGYLPERSVDKEDVKLRIAEALKHRAEIRKQQQLQQWIDEKHTCEHCGKVMIEKYGSGRFCCQSCANSKKHSEETKQKISTGVSQSQKTLDIHLNHITKYNDNPNLCKICGSPIAYERRKKVTCGAEECDKQMRSIIAKKGGKASAVKHPIHKAQAKKGWYKGFWCDSSWELAYVIYCLEHDIKIERNWKSFEYILDGESHLYFPDFYLPDENTYVEIKGYEHDKDTCKFEQFPENLKVYRKKDLLEILTYAKTTYGNNYVKLYESTNFDSI